MVKQDIIYCGCGGTKKPKGSKPVFRPKPLGGNSNGANGTKGKD